MRFLQKIDQRLCCGGHGCQDLVEGLIARLNGNINVRCLALVKSAGSTQIFGNLNSGSSPQKGGSGQARGMRP